MATFTVPAHPPVSQVFRSFGLVYRALGPNRWTVEGHGEMTSKDLYALQALSR